MRVSKYQERWRYYTYASHLCGADLLNQFVYFRFLPFTQLFDFPGEFESAHGVDVLLLRLVIVVFNVMTQSIESGQGLGA